MLNKDYPGLFQSAEASATMSQRRHFFCLKTSLLVLVFGAGLALSAENTKAAAAAAAVLFLITIGITLLMAFKRFEKSWYTARAVAESVKTRAWRFMMQAEPYQTDDSASQLFVEDLKTILRENEDTAKSIPAGQGEAISPEMRRVRSLSLAERMDYYKRNRVDDQLGWYVKQAAVNRTWNIVWFSLMILFQVGALVCVILKLGSPTAKAIPTGLFTTLAGAALSWSQARRFAELSASYNLTAHEISIISSNYTTLTDEQRFSSFVRDTEAAFSREHTLWVAKRGV